MVRLMLVLAPVMCILGGIAMSGMLHRYMKDLDAGSVMLGTAATPAPVSKGGDKRSKLKADSNYVMRSEVLLELFFNFRINNLLNCRLLPFLWASCASSWFRTLCIAPGSPPRPTALHRSCSLRDHTTTPASSLTISVRRTIGCE